MAFDHHITVTSPHTIKKQRLDRFISNQLEDFSRQRIQSLIKQGYVQEKEGRVITNPSTTVKSCIEYVITIPPIQPSDIIPNHDIILDIIYEDDDLLVINKQAGLTVHPGAGNYQDTLVNALIARFQRHGLSAIGGIERPGIVHRLDKDTSGLMIVAKNDQAHLHLSEQLSTRTLSRQYSAICWHTPKQKNGIIQTKITRHPTNRIKMHVHESKGREAITHYKVQSSFLDGIISMVECRLKTGRTHQIRVHMQHIGHPIIGDTTYGKRHQPLKETSEVLDSYLKECKRQLLHAKSIGFIHPKTNKPMEFTIGLPNDMQHLLDLIQ